MALNTNPILINNKTIVSIFKELPKTFRIEAVIHDGQWYTKEKWAKVAKVPVKEVEDFIDITGYLIKENNSYRVSSSQIIKWYEDNNLDISVPIVPNNFTPKIWAGISETEHFINSPKRLINSISFTCEKSDLLDKVKNIVYGYGRFATIFKNKYSVYTLNAVFVKEKLQNELTEEEFSSLNVRIRNNFLRRELSDLDSEFLENALDFYVRFAFGALKSHMKTMDIFLPGMDEKKAQILDWIIQAIYKFDETATVPFSGYLTNVLQRWPYDLPEIALGKEMAVFQRRKSEAINKLTSKLEQQDFSEDLIFEEMTKMYDDKFTRQVYASLTEEHDRWVQIKQTSHINWKENNAEKHGVSVFQDNSDNYSPELAHNMTMSLLKSLRISKDLVSFYSIINNFGKDDLTSSDLEISENFKEIFKSEITKHIIIR